VALAVAALTLASTMSWHREAVVGALAGDAVARPAKAQDPRVWAGVSVSVPNATTNAMFSAAETPRLMIGVALVNDGPAPIPFDRATTRLIINGEAVALFDDNGPVWTQVAPGKPFGASTGSVAKQFARPGLYKIQWVGDGFSSPVLEFRVTQD
jgi:hypothetical protein